MNILYTFNSAQPGGMEYHVLDLVKGMVQKRHNVFVWMPQGPLTQDFVLAGAHVTSVEVGVTWGVDIDPKYISKLIKFLKKEKIQVLHCHELRAVGNSLIAAFFARTKARVSHIHTPFSEWQVPSWKRFLYSKSYALATTLFTSAEIALTQSRSLVKAKEGIPTKKLVVIPNAVDMGQFESDLAKKFELRKEMCKRYDIDPLKSMIYGCISRISAEKGHRVVLDAFEKFLQNFKAEGKKLFHLMFIGGGPMEEEIRDLIKTKGLEDYVVVTGRFSEQDRKNYYAMLDTFIHASLAEGFGITLLEAMASNVPIIASDLEVFKEVAGDTISYFETGNSNSLVATMLNIKDGNISAAKALERVRTLYTMEKFIRNYEELYESLIAR